MKKMKAVSAFAALMLGMTLTGSMTMAEKQTEKVDVLFLHDTHSHINSFSTVEEGTSQVLGGFAKLKTLIDEKKEENPETILLDAGDFSMGTLTQILFEEEASELRMLGALGMDAVTLGNHEFDYQAEGLAGMMNRAVESGDALPAVVMSNVDWEGMEAAGLTEDQQLLYDAFQNYGVKEYLMLEQNGVKIAVTGSFGEDCLDCAPTCCLLFENPVEAMKETVAYIQEHEDADMIVCVSHGGTWANEDISEDEILAKNVPELDLIISGHTHTKLEEPIVHGDTYIVSAYEYGKFLGSLSMSRKENGRWAMDEYELIPVDESVQPDAEIQAQVDSWMGMVEGKYLDQFGLTKDQVLAVNDIVFPPSAELSDFHTEMNLGSIIADAYTYAAENIADESKPVDIAIAPAGTIRETYGIGPITVENVFNSFCLGMGPDGNTGYPMISVYLTGAELKIVAEIDASISDLMSSARLYSDGLYWHYNPNRMILNKVTDVFLVNGNEERAELENDKLYRVVTDFYSSQMLGSITDLSYGLLSIVPKHEDGTPIENYEDAIVKVDGKELKCWVAIAKYMESFEDTDGDGIGNVPEKYGTLEGRKVVEDSKNPIDLLKNPNKFFFMIVGAVFVLISLVTGAVVFVRKLVKRRKNKKKEN